MGFPIFADAFEGKLFKFYDVKNAILSAQKQIVKHPTFVVIRQFGLVVETERPGRGFSFYKVSNEKVLKYAWDLKIKDYKIEQF